MTTTIFPSPPPHATGAMAQAIAAQLRPVWGEDTRDQTPKAITLPREAWAAVVAALTAMQPS